MLVALGLPTFIAGVIAIECLVEGFVAMTLWRWFAVPIFGAPALSYAAAVGVCLLATSIGPTYTPIPREGDGKAKTLEWIFGKWILRPLFLLGVGALAHAAL
ncbi:MAG TPA: hypothetical protein VFN76_09860 [Candidatus Limnocylindria bacterium]|nr:hypothetical protein [Candidatus Limnocylindria bacterium]